MSKVKRNSGQATAVKSPRRRKPSAASRTPAIANGKSIYAVHPSIAMMQKCIGELKKKTGRSFDEWMKFIKRSGPESEKAVREWLKQAHFLGTNTASWLAVKAFAGPTPLVEESPEGYLSLAPQYVDEMYSGPKSALRLIHDEIVRLTLLLGGDVRVCPCKTIVPLFRRHVFAQIKPASAKRIDLGFALGEEPFTARLRDNGGLAKKDRITHTVALTSLSDIDLQVKRWLKQAYERDG